MKPARWLTPLLLLLLAGCRSSLLAELAAGSGGVLFQDDFSSPTGGWPELDGPDGRMGLVEGGYRIQVNRPGYDLWSFPGQAYREARVEVDATQLAGPDSNRFGLACRARDGENFYFFIVSSDGYYALGVVEAGLRQLLGQEMMAYSTAILPAGQTNRLRFDCAGEVLTGFVNGQVIAITEDSRFANGDAGLLAGTFDQAGVEILFDNFTVLRP